MIHGQGYHHNLPPGAMPLPGLASAGTGYPATSSYTPNGYLNGPVSQSSPRMMNNNEGYYYNQY
jgi:hypothetical protein